MEPIDSKRSIQLQPGLLHSLKERGKIYYLPDIQGVNLSAFHIHTPLTTHYVFSGIPFYLVADQEVTIYEVETASKEEEKRWIDEVLPLLPKQLDQDLSLEEFSEFCTRAMAKAEQHRMGQDLFHLQQKAQSQVRQFSTTLEHAQKTLFSSAPSTIDPIHHSDLEKALQLIGKHLHIEFVFPSGGDLEAICEASGVRCRSIILEEGEKVEGTLLCFQSGKPIACIDGSLTGKQVDREAFQLYPSLSKKIQTGKQLCFHLLKRYLRTDLSLFLYGAIGGIIALWPPVATSLFFGFAVPQSDHSLIHYLFFSLIAAAIGAGCFYILRNLAYLRIESLASHFMQTALWDRCLRLPLSFFNKYLSGELYWKLASVEMIRTLIHSRVSSALINGAFALLYLVVMFVYSPLLAVIVTLLFALFMGMSYRIAKRKATQVVKEAEFQQKTQGILVQMIGGVKKIRTTLSEKSAFSHWLSHYTESRKFQQEAQRLQNVIATYTAALPILTLGALYMAVIFWIGPKNIALPTFLAFISAFTAFAFASYPLNEVLGTIAQVQGLWIQAKDVITEPMEKREGGIKIPKLKGQIDFENVSFTYPHAQEETLKNISFSLSSGESLGIVGPSGSGKSTLFRLLLGLKSQARV